jgi:serine protease Do
MKKHRPALMRTVAMAVALGLVGSAQAQAPVNRDTAPPPPVSATGAAPTSFAEIIEKVAPAVVSIEVRRPASTASARLPFNLPAPFGEQAPDQGTRQARSSGAGFFISADGYLVTNNHVVENATDIKVVLADEREFAARVVGRDPLTDLAVLKVEGRALPFVTFANAAVPRVGDWVVAVGNPYGLGGTATAGIVSAYGREVGSTFVDYIQIDAAINRGNSGGPTFDAQGRVIGVNSMIFSPSGGSVGIGFAIPAYIAADVTQRLIATGKIERGYIGATIQTVTTEMAESLGMAKREGALVAEVTPGAPADRAGLRGGDIVVSVNGQAVDNASQFTRRVAATTPGQSLTLSVLRDGASRAMTLTTALRPGEAQINGERGPSSPSAPTTRPGALGLSVRPLDEAARQRLNLPATLRGALIEGVTASSDAASKGLRVGDVVVRAQGREVSGPDDLAAAVAQARTAGRPSVLLFVHRAGRQLAVVVRLETP